MEIVEGISNVISVIFIFIVDSMEQLVGRELEIIVEFFFVMFNNNEFLDVCFKFFNEIVEEKCVLKVYKLIFVI